MHARVGKRPLIIKYRTAEEERRHYCYGLNHQKSSRAWHYGARVSRTYVLSSSSRLVYFVAHVRSGFQRQYTCVWYVRTEDQARRVADAQDQSVVGGQEPTTMVVRFPRHGTIMAAGRSACRATSLLACMLHCISSRLRLAPEAAAGRRRRRAVVARRSLDWLLLLVLSAWTLHYPHVARCVARAAPCRTTFFSQAHRPEKPIIGTGVSATNGSSPRPLLPSRLTAGWGRHPGTVIWVMKIECLRIIRHCPMVFGPHASASVG